MSLSYICTTADSKLRFANPKFFKDIFSEKLQAPASILPGRSCM